MNIEEQTQHYYLALKSLLKIIIPVKLQNPVQLLTNFSIQVKLFKKYLHFSIIFQLEFFNLINLSYQLLTTFEHLFSDCTQKLHTLTLRILLYDMYKK